MPPVLCANTELVAVAWLGGVSGLSPGMVATELPRDQTTWSANGFATVHPAGGSSNVDVPLREPVVTVNTWGVNPTSAKPPWGKAANIAELIVRGCRASNLQRTLTLRTGFPSARVLGAEVISEVRRAPADPANYARFIFDLYLHWIELP